MITQRLKIDGANITKQDGSLYPCWGHNYDNLNILDAGAYAEIIENVWGGSLYATGGIFTITNISWSWTGTGTIYDVTVTVKEPLSSNTFSNTDLITIAGTPTFTGVNAIGGASIQFSIEGASTDANNNRSSIAEINTTNNTIKFSQNLKNFIVNGSTSVSSGFLGVGSIEFDLAILKNIANSKMIRICLQLDKFLFGDQGYEDALENGYNLEDPATYTINQDQLDSLVAFLDLAAKYDIYVIINGANAWVAGNQPNWLNFSTEKIRWTAQAAFWQAIAKTVATHPAVAWYSLINEPLDQYNDYKISTYVENDSGDFDTLSAVDSRGGSVRKSGESGYALMSNSDGSKIELIKYNDLSGTQSSTTTITLYQINRYPFAELITDDELSTSWISLIDKAPDIFDLSLTQTTEGSTTAVIDLYSNKKKFVEISGSTYNTVIGFSGDSTTLGVGQSPQSNRFSSKIISTTNADANVNPKYSEINYGATGAVLSSNSNGYGQVLKNYPNGNTYWINSLNFGINDFVAYGQPYGYNYKFFTQSLRVILSRLKSEYVQEFSGLSGFSSVSLDDASGGSYQKTTSDRSITFSTTSGFTGGTIAIGFMIENGSSAQVEISINGKKYRQSLVSGEDVRSGITAPLVKRIPDVPSGANTFTITFTNVIQSACLDYWQIESKTPAPIIVNSIYQFSSYPNISVWNQEIRNLIFSEFFDGSVIYLDVNSVLISSDFTGSNLYPNASGHTKLASAYNNVIVYKNLIPRGGISTSNYIYTYTTSTEHGLNKSDIVYIEGATPSALNGTFTITNIPTATSFTVTGSISNPSNPSIVNATYSAQNLKTNTTYNITSDTIPDGNGITFTTGDSIISSGGLYTITLSSSNGVVTSSDLTRCEVTNETEWIGSSSLGYDRHYTPFVTLTPRGRSKTQIAKEWVSTIVSAIREIDNYTFITVPTTMVFGNELSPDDGGFGPTNLNSITVNGNPAIDIFSVHQYASLNKTPEQLANNLKTISDYGKPVILEEGAIPLNKTSFGKDGVRKTSNYLLKSKRYLAGALNNYQGYYNLGVYGWTPWTNDFLYFQYLYNSLNDFLNDAPVNDSEVSSVIHTAYDGPSNFPDKDVNKPEITGRRYLVPSIDLSSTDFSFNNTSDTLAPSSYADLPVDGAYIAETQLVKNNSILPQTNYIWFNNTSVSTNSTQNIYLNNLYLGVDQNVVSIKTIANLKHGPSSALNVLRPNANTTNTNWSVYQSGSGKNFVTVVNVPRTTTLASSITSSSTQITLVSASNAGLTAPGVVLIDNEYIQYSSLSGNTLTVATNGRGYYNTIPASHNGPTTNPSALGATVKNNTPSTSTYGVRTKYSGASNVAIDWKLDTPTNVPSGSYVSSVDVWVLINVDGIPFNGSDGDSKSTKTVNPGTPTNLRTLHFTTNPGWTVGQYVTSGSLPVGTKVQTAAVPNSSTSKWDLVLDQYPTGTIVSGASLTARTPSPQQTAKITIKNYAGTKTYKTLDKYKGFWQGTSLTVTYSEGDLVYYNGYIWMADVGDNRRTPSSSPTSINPSTGNPYWIQVTQADIDTSYGSQFVWIKLPFYYDGSNWKDGDTGSVVADFYPDQLKVEVVNTNTSTTFDTFYISISDVHANAFTNGSLDPSGSQILQGQLWRINQYVKEGNASVSFSNNSTNGWITSNDQYNDDGRYSQSFFNTNDYPLIFKFVPIASTVSRDIPKSYNNPDSSNLNINTVYVEVKIKETLSRKGNPIVSMG